MDVKIEPLEDKVEILSVKTKVISLESEEQKLNETFSKYLQSRKNKKHYNRKVLGRRKNVGRANNTSFRSSRRKPQVIPRKKAIDETRELVELADTTELANGLSKPSLGATHIKDSKASIIPITSLPERPKKRTTTAKPRRSTTATASLRRNLATSASTLASSAAINARTSAASVDGMQKSSIAFFENVIAMNRIMFKREKFKLVLSDVEKVSGLRTREAKKAMTQYETARLQQHQKGKELLEVLSQIIASSGESSEADEDRVVLSSHDLGDLMKVMQRYQESLEVMRKGVYDTSVTLLSVLNKSILNYSLASNMKAHANDLDKESMTHIKYFLDEVPAHVYIDDEHQEALVATSPFQRAIWVDAKFGGTSGSASGAAGGTGSVVPTNKQTAYVTKFNTLINRDVPDAAIPRYPC